MELKLNAEAVEDHGYGLIESFIGVDGYNTLEAASYVVAHYRELFNRPNADLDEVLENYETAKALVEAAEETA